ncbi:hypothetical protein HDV00_003108 [Rhizophlyctis rosea]|nr:hypothetical protein HDV00_003108 [Rhizophlyctis rosea]
MGRIHEHVPINSLSRSHYLSLHPTAPLLNIYADEIYIYNYETRKLLGQMAIRQNNTTIPIVAQSLAADLVAFICAGTPTPLYIYQYDFSEYTPLKPPNLLADILHHSPFYQFQDNPAVSLNPWDSDVSLNTAGTRMIVVMKACNQNPVRLTKHGNGDVADHAWHGLLIYNIDRKTNAPSILMVHDLDRMMDFIVHAQMQPGRVYDWKTISTLSEGIPAGAASFSDHAVNLLDTAIHGQLAVMLWQIRNPGNLLEPNVAVGVDCGNGKLLWAIALNGFGMHQPLAAPVLLGGISSDGACWWVTGLGEAMVADCSGTGVNVSGLAVDTLSSEGTEAGDKQEVSEEDPASTHGLTGGNVDADKCIRGDCVLWMERRVVSKDVGREAAYEFVFKPASL